jgi:large subunit ribosomal protein L11
MAKQVTAQVKVQITAGQATPAPPVGTSLGPHGINLGQFCTQFNDKTKEIKGTVVPVIVTVYNDRTFEFIIKSPPAAVLLKQAAQVAKGSARPNAEKVGKVTMAQVREIAQRKFQDLNAPNIDQAARIVAGTARSMGIDVIE